LPADLILILVLTLVLTLDLPGVSTDIVRVQNVVKLS